MGSPNRHPSGCTMEEFAQRSKSPPSSPSLGSTAKPESPEGVSGSPSKTNLFRAAGRAAQLGAKMSAKGGGSLDATNGKRRIIKETGDGASKSVRSYDKADRGDGFGMSNSTSLPSLSKESMTFDPPAAYVRAVERKVGTPCSRR